MDKQPDSPAPDQAPWIDLPAIWRSGWRAFGLQAPLSGDVNQAFDAAPPISSIGDQLGLININATRAGDARLEQRITEQVASYGRQLGWVVDALDVLIRTGRPAVLDSDDAAALDQVTVLRADVEAAKQQLAQERIDRLVADIRILRQDPQRYATELQHLRRALEGD
ncbi:MAG TPA: hypothetical protein VN520_21195 [Streptomyces sp.]|uniref:hypothetical protein n=1 Tax=Streptomyces sp. TaxID=1931 RepID=UPI002BECD764|nr:hypothetical protein [Streptomyces sp.]HWU08865.1 hypothetical protein [Streptomyces sp.]